MTGSVVMSLIYTLLPCLIAAYAAAVYLTPRAIPPRTAWIMGLLIATLLTWGVATVTNDSLRGAIPVSTLVLSYSALYGIPTIALTGVAVAIKGRVQPRWVGILVLVVVFFAANVVGRMVAGHYFPMVNASG